MLFGAAVYRGVEQLDHQIRYWNVVLGLNDLPDCTLTATGTASNGALDGYATPDGASYPFITWNVTLSDGDGGRACTREPVDASGGQVATDYALAGSPEEFDFSFGPDGVGSRLPPAKLVFVTSQTFSASFGTAAGADTRCQTAANGAGIGVTQGRTFRAWICDHDDQPLDNLVHWTGDYVRTDGTVVAHGWDEMTREPYASYPLLAAIDKDESGAPQTGLAWSGCLRSGTRYMSVASSYCNDWSYIGPANTTTAGDVTSTTYWHGQWSGGGICQQNNHFLCFEQ